MSEDSSHFLTFWLKAWLGWERSRSSLGRAFQSLKAWWIKPLRFFSVLLGCDLILFDVAALVFIFVVPLSVKMFLIHGIVLSMRIFLVSVMMEWMANWLTDRMPRLERADFMLTLSIFLTCIQDLVMWFWATWRLLLMEERGSWSESLGVTSIGRA